MMKFAWKNIKKDLKREGIAYLNTPEGQANIYKIGVLIGNGAKQGAGFGGKIGKLSLEGLVTQFIVSYIGPKLGMNMQQQGNEQAQQQEQSQDLSKTSLVMK